MSRRVPLARKRFGELTVSSRFRPTGEGAEWLCRCSCGAEVWVLRGNLMRGYTKSCGLNHDLRMDKSLEECHAAEG